MRLRLPEAIIFSALSLPLISCAQKEETDKESESMQHTNHLIEETSPYLLQHAHNPVDWYPWGDAAFEKAKREDKPIFLSVGYSTCYWCHVMEKESFEDPEVAEIMNENYISIKVDREERPDVDEQYMLATQLVTGRGGWPNSVWLTPEGKPWMAGTYFPKPQFKQALRQMAGYWENQRKDVEAQAAQLASHISQIGDLTGQGKRKPSMELVSNAIQQLNKQYDETYAGFGSAPKFPPHGTLRLFLAWSQVREDTSSLLKSVTRTLDAMWLGGIHDHIGGGFHRYSTDAKWLLPHFEKMLYDNAQLLRIYAEAAAVTGKPLYEDAVADIHEWVRREMTHPDGGFYSAIDSGEVGEEGAFYLWKEEELQSVLGEADAALFSEIYGFEKEGNFREESTGKKTGENIPHLMKPISEIAKERGMEPGTLHDQLAALSNRLMKARRKRPYPHKDDKILTSWNGLMIEALAYAGAKLGEPEYTKAAARAADFILQNMWTGTGLLRSYREGRAHQEAFLDDHAYFAAGLLELHAATGKEHWLDAARKLGNTLLAEFQDRESGGFFLTPHDSDTLLARSKALTGGGNLPSANGIAARVLMELSERTGDPRYAEAAASTLATLAGIASERPFSQEHVLLSILHQEHPEQFIGGSKYTAQSSRGVGNSKGNDHAARGKPEKDQDIGNGNQVTERSEPVTFRLSSSKERYSPGDIINLSLNLEIDSGWHLYGDNPEIDFLVPVKVEPFPLPRITPGEVKAPAPREKHDPFLDQVVRTYEGTARFAIPFEIKDDAAPGPAVVALKVRTQACDAERCLPPEETILRLPLKIAAK